MERYRILDRTPLVVGEGPVWDERKGLLYTIDIRGKCIRMWDSATGTHSQVNYGQEIGCIVLTEEGKLLAAMEDGIYLAHEDGTVTPVCVPERLKGRRFNDGKVGPDGRFYVGTTDYNQEGAFYRLDEDGKLTELFDQVGCSNGMAWSRDEKTLYYCDSPSKKLEAFDFDGRTGELFNRRTIMGLPCEYGEFDGMTIDAEDNLWIAMWGSSSIFHIDPEKGRVLEQVIFPVSRVSCCGFAGEELNTLIITTAAYQAEFSSEPEAGFTYAMKTTVPGRISWRYRGKLL